MIGIAGSAIRTALATACAVVIALCLTVAGTVSVAVSLAATALIVPGTATPDPAAVPGYMDNAVDYYIAPTTPSCAVVCTAEPVPYIAQFWPFPFAGWGGLSGAKFDVSVASGVQQLSSDLVGTYPPGPDDPVVIFGYSQGATVASREKFLLSKLSAEDQANISFVLIGSPNRPNGGLFERLAAFGTVPILDATFGLPTPTDTAMSTVDVAFEYDGVADFPLYPINLLATLNAVAGFWYIHGSMLSPNGNNLDDLPNGLTPAELAAAIADPANQQRTAGSDTTYVLIPTPNLPLLQPLREFGASTGLEFITTLLIDLVQPALRVLIETGYDRTLPYSEPTPLRLIPLVNPFTLAVDLADAVGQGINDVVNDIRGEAPAATSAAAVPAAVKPVATQRSVKAVQRSATPSGDRTESALRTHTGPQKASAASSTALRTLPDQRPVRRAPAP
jgi:hypothetical protein